MGSSLDQLASSKCEDGGMITAILLLPRSLRGAPCWPLQFPPYGLGAGVVLILLSMLAAFRPSSIFYAEFPTDVEATFECGSAALRADVDGDMADQVGAQQLCNEQHTIFMVLSLVALALGVSTVLFGSRRRGDTPAEQSEVTTK